MSRRISLLIALACLAGAAPASAAAPVFGPAEHLDLDRRFAHTALTAADVDGDGRPDLVAAGPGSVVAFFQTTSGPLLDYDYPGLSAPTTVQVADLDGDGRGEIITSGPGAGLSVLASTTDRWAHVRNDPPAAPRGNVAIADVTGDGRADLILSSVSEPAVLVASLEPDGAWRVRRHRVDGALGYVQAFPGSSVVVDHVAGRAVMAQRDGELTGPLVLPGRLTEDWRHDLDRDGADERFWLSAGNAVVQWSGGLQTAHAFGGRTAQLPRVADLDGDGLLDLAALSDAAIRVLAGRPAGTFAPPVAFPLVAGERDSALAFFDADRDGRPDAVTAHADGLHVRHNRTAPVTLAVPEVTHGDTITVTPRLSAFPGLVGRVVVRGTTPDGSYHPPREVRGSLEPVTFVADQDGEHRFWAEVEGADGGQIVTGSASVATRVRGSLRFSVEGPAPFGALAVHERATRTVRVVNTGPHVLRGLAPSVRIEPAFTLERHSCHGVVSVGEACTIDVTFRPTAAGAHAGVLEIGTHEVQLSGVGIEPTIVLPLPAPPAPPVPPAPIADDPPAAWRVRLAVDARAGRESTRLRVFRIENLPRDSYVRVTCRNGCTRRTLTRHYVTGTLSLRSFATTPLKVGTRVTIRILALRRGELTATLTIRSRRAPTVTTKLVAF